jgi:hypothetical protein
LLRVADDAELATPSATAPDATAPVPPTASGTSGPTSSKDRQPLNPAYAILVGAVLTATAGLAATIINVRSSERLSKERQKADTATQANVDLQNQLDQLRTQLADANDKLASLTSGPSTTAPVPSIVVVLPSAAPPPSGATTVPPSTVTTVGHSATTTTTTTKAAGEPSTTVAPSTTVSASTTVPVSSSAVPASAVPSTTVPVSTTTSTRL